MVERVARAGLWLICVGGAFGCTLSFDQALLDGAVVPGDGRVFFPDGGPTGPCLVGREIYAGNEHACVLGVDGRISCWGDNSNGQIGVGSEEPLVRVPTIVTDGQRYTALDLGSNHTCAIKDDGTLYCWGYNGSGQLGNGNTTSLNVPMRTGIVDGWTRISAGSNHTCAIREDGTLFCWGGNGAGQLGVGDETDHSAPIQVGTDTNWAEVSAGGGFTCAIKSDASLYCWGANGDGELGQGDGDTTSRATPTRVGTDTDWSLVTTGEDHACALKTDGRAFCWGINDSGQGGFGSGSPAAVFVPTLVNAPTTWTYLTAGLYSTCAIAENGTAWCWGAGWGGNLGNGGSSQPQPAAVSSEETWSRLAGGYIFSCGLTAAGLVRCWGDNHWGQLGTGQAGRDLDRDAPAAVMGGPFAQLSAGPSHSCAVSMSGEASCWGSNGSSRSGGTGLVSLPRAVSGSGFAAVSAGYDHSVAVRTDGTVWGWGANENGMLGTGGTGESDVPVMTLAVADMTKPAAGDHHTCAIRSTDQALLCWGRNGSGQLGLGDDLERHDATVVADTTTWLAVDAGNNYTCGVRTDGSLWCWGRNSYGVLGVGDETGRNTPTQVGTDVSWASVAADQHTCAIKTDGTLWCWGYNGYGQLGVDGDSRNAPIQVQTDTWTKVAVGGYTTCGIRTTGALFCWGNNDDGQLGNGSRRNTRTPTQVGTDTDWIDIGVGEEHTCGLRAGGVPYCWGHNGSGQLGTGERGSDYDTNVPIRQCTEE